MIEEISLLLGECEYLPWLPELIAALILLVLIIVLLNLFFSFVGGIFKL